MKKTILIILWVVILVGSTLIGIVLFKPETLNREENISETQIEETEIITDKTAAQFLVEGNRKLNEGYYEEAISLFLQAKDKEPDSVDILNKLGEAYTLATNYPEATATLEEALKLKPTSINQKLKLAQAYLNERNIDKAKGIVFAIETDRSDIKYYKGIIYLLFKDYENSKKLFAEVATDNSITSKVEKKYAQKFTDVFTFFDSFAEGDNLYLETMLGKTLADTQQYGPAIRLLYDVLEQKTEYRDAWIVLGYSYLNTGKAKDAIDALEKAKALDEKKPQTFFFLGLAYFADNNIDKAIFNLEQADKFGFEPKEQIDLKLGDLYLLKENFDKAATKYESVLARNTTNIEIFVRAVWLNIEKVNRPEKALAIAQKSLESYSDNAMSHNLVGWAQIASENYEEAEKSLEKALEISPKFAAAYYNLGLLYEKKGQKNLSREYYKKATLLGKNTSIANLAALRYKALTENDKNNFYKINISSPK